MRETPIYQYYAFGYNYHTLRRLSQGGKAKGTGMSTLEGRITRFLRSLENLDLPVTAGAADDLREVLDEVQNLGGDPLVDEPLATRVRAAVEKLDATLDSEMKIRKAFVVTPKRFDLKHLLEAPLQLLGETSVDTLPEIAQFDFSNACRCIAFSLPTSAAFHLMRCVEGMLREYYCTIVKRDRVDPLLWYAMVKHLQARRHSPPKALLDHLDNIRANFRNPTQHPDARYDMEEAQDLLNVVVDALNRMCRDLTSRKS